MKITSTYWFHLLMNTICFIVLAICLPICYEQNDDVAMCMIANGLYGGEPDCHLVFINAIYGWIVSGLYRIWNGIEWYALIFAVLHILSMSVVTFLVSISDRIQIWLKIVFFITLYVLWAYIITNFQFTTTAALTCFAGCIAMWHNAPKWRWIGMLFILIASLIRVEAAALVGIVFAPLFILSIIKDKKICYYLGLTVVLACGLYYADRFFYKSPEWAEYREYNILRGKINDNPNADLSEDQMPEGIHYEDYKLLTNFYADPTIITVDALKRIHAAIVDKSSTSKSLFNVQYAMPYRVQLLILLLGYVVCIISAFFFKK